MKDSRHNASMTARLNNEKTIRQNVCKAQLITMDMHCLLIAAVRSLDMVGRLCSHVIRVLKFAIVEPFKNITSNKQKRLYNSRARWPDASSNQ